MIKVLSREADKSMLGLNTRQSASLPSLYLFLIVCAHFSSEVARLVTQPEWPSRVPRRISVSVILSVVVVSECGEVQLLFGSATSREQLCQCVEFWCQDLRKPAAREL